MFDRAIEGLGRAFVFTIIVFLKFVMLYGLISLSIDDIYIMLYYLIRIISCYYITALQISLVSVSKLLQFLLRYNFVVIGIKYWIEEC